MAGPAAIGPMFTTDLSSPPDSTSENKTRSATQSNPVTTYTNIPLQSSYAQQQATVYIEKGFDSDEWEPGGVIDWSSIVEPLDGQDFVANLRVLALDYQSGDHFSEMLERLTPDRRVRIGIPITGTIAVAIFQGYVKGTSITWSERGQGLSATVLSEVQEWTRHGRGTQTSIVHGRMMRNDPVGEWNAEDVSSGIDHVTGLQAIFNANGKGNMTSLAVLVLVDPPQGEEEPTELVPYRMHFFQTDDNIVAVPWTYRDALRYVVFFYLAKIPLSPTLDVSAFMFDTEPTNEVADLLDTLLSQEVKPDLSIESMNVESAIKALVEAAGLHFHWSTFGISRGGDQAEFTTKHTLRVVATKTGASDPTPRRRRQMGVSNISSIPRRAAFEDLSNRTERGRIVMTRALSAQLTVDSSRLINRPIYLGGYEEHECSIILRPGWLPHANLDNVVCTVADGLLTGDAYDDAFDAAQTVWHKTNFPEFEPGGGLSVRTRYHGQHKDFHEVDDVMRLWIFPDDDFYVEQGGDTSDFARNTTGSDTGGVNPGDLNVRQAWTLPDYMPFFHTEGETEQENGLAYRDPLFGGGLSAETLLGWVPRPRPFQNTQGRFDFATKEQAPIVRIHFGEDFDPYIIPQPNSDGWTRFAGGVEILTDIAGIRFVDDNIWNSPPFLLDPARPLGVNAFERYIKGRFWVQITACVRSDKRMRFAPTAFSFGGSLASQRLRHVVKDMGYTRFQIRSIDKGNSYLTARVDSNELPLVDFDDNFLGRDDTDRLEAFGDHDGASDLSSGAAGYWTQPWLDVGIGRERLGDSFVGVTALGIQWESYPVLTSKVHLKTPAGHQSTKYILQDIRHNPEVAQG